MKMKEFGPGEGGGVPGALLGSANDSVRARLTKKRIYDVNLQIQK